MNIDQYYQQGGRSGAGANVPSPGASRIQYTNMVPHNVRYNSAPQYSPPVPTGSGPELDGAFFDQRTPEQQNRLYGVYTNMQQQPPAGGGRVSEEEYQAAYAAIHNDSFFRSLDPDTQNSVQSIYMRHVQSGTYGTQEMFNEIRAAVQAGAARQASLNTPEPASEPVQPRLDYPAYIQSGAMNPGNRYYGRPWTEWMQRHIAATQGGQKPTPPRLPPTIGGPGGLPGPR